MGFSGSLLLLVTTVLINLAIFFIHREMEHSSRVNGRVPLCKIDFTRLEKVSKQAWRNFSFS